MAAGIGSAVIDFGTFPGSNEASVIVTGQTDITAASKAEAYIMADSTTTDHTASDHRYAAVFMGLTCGTPTAATGFTISARSTEKLTGSFEIQWVWAEQE
jgi:hypothetical protein